MRSESMMRGYQFPRIDETRQCQKIFVADQLFFLDYGRSYRTRTRHSCKNRIDDLTLKFYPKIDVTIYGMFRGLTLWFFLEISNAENVCLSSNIGSSLEYLILGEKSIRLE